MAMGRMARVAIMFFSVGGADTWELINISAIGSDPFLSVFIRAPYIESIGESVEVFAKYEDRVVGVHQGICRYKEIKED